jgi:hypothetical protein
VSALKFLRLILLQVPEKNMQAVDLNVNYLSRPPLWSSDILNQSPYLILRHKLLLPTPKLPASPINPWRGRLTSPAAT